MRRMREDHLHRNYSDVNERPIRCRAKLIQPKAGMAARLAMIPSAYNGTFCPATAASNGGSSERSSEGCRPVSSASCRSVAALAPGRSVEQERASKFQKQGRLCAIRAAPWLKENLMNPNIDFLGICQLLKALRTVGFSETEIKKIARRIAVELGANFTLYA